MTPAYGTFQCMNKLCGKVYKHGADMLIHRCGVEGCLEEGTEIGYTLGHSCPYCGSIYLKWMDFEKNWECTQETGWKWQRKLLLTESDKKDKVEAQ